MRPNGGACPLGMRPNGGACLLSMRAKAACHLGMRPNGEHAYLSMRGSRRHGGRIQMILKIQGAFRL